ncbi:hypothetical protein BCR36DRAFT_405561 [Piromyces finnis]|uniref:Uncharacterized protein n=1 Tax=Piromyces finnis TaxID=1754191 RepID=A0A1Y1V529_9FUNG|nr:hypothetical protein BCR36DRAFT_405561 [Piromyces finnis]|eukprot:ORX46599.1 hypothetical protein BCR36DRAFT_405561 [Piromyces finnis]
MGFGFKQICIITAVGTSVVAGVAIASRNDYNAEKMWSKTKKSTVQMSKKAAKAIHLKKNKASDSEKIINDIETTASLTRVINVSLEDSEIIVANGSTEEIEEATEFKTITLPAINQISQTKDFSSNLFFINGDLDNAKLRKTLEILLNTYNILSGRLTNNKKTGLYEIYLNNKGVFFSIVKYDGNMIDILPDTKENILSPDYSNLYGQNYTMKQYVSLSLPILQIRITHFNDNKTCIGVRYPSIIADITSIAKFIEDWSVLYRGEEIQKKTVFNYDWISQSVNVSHDDNLPSTYQPLAFNKIKSIKWFKLAFEMFYEWITGGGFQTKHFFISDKQLEELRNQVIADAKFANEKQTPIQSPTSDNISPVDSTNIDWISAKDVLIAHIWKKISVLPRRLAFSNRVFKCSNLREYVENIDNVFGNMNVYAVTPLTYITLLSQLYYLSKKIHTSIVNLSIQLQNLLQWINSKETTELPLISVPAILFGKQSDLLVDDLDVDRSNIRFTSDVDEKESDVVWIYKESKPSIPNCLSIVRTSELTNDSLKGYYIYLTLSRIDMNTFIDQGGL